MLQVTNEKTFSFAYNLFFFFFVIAAAASTVVTVFIIGIVL